MIFNAAGGYEHAAKERKAQKKGCCGRECEICWQQATYAELYGNVIGCLGWRNVCIDVLFGGKQIFFQ